MVRYAGVDEIDAAILDILTTDGRIGYAELGRRLHLTRATVRERVQHLTSSGVIQGFTVVIDPRAVGRQVLAFLEIDVEPTHLAAAAHALAEDENVLSVNQMTGPSTLHVHVALTDQTHLREFLQLTVYALKGATMVKTYLLLHSFKSRFGGLKIG